MKVLQVNIFGNLSTGKIAVDIYRTLLGCGHEGMVAYARNSIPSDVASIKIGTSRDVVVHGILARLTDKAGFYSSRATKHLLQKIDEYDPDIIHLHNLHGYYINIELLFKYLKKRNKPVVWTLHDYWPFTGHCAYFDMVGCEKWKTGCQHCPQKHEYPSALLLDNSKWNYKKKKELFTGVGNLTLVTNANWLRHLVAESFLKEYQAITIHNGIDLEVFKPVTGSFREKYGLKGKTIVLGVASTWDTRKGLADFVKLSDMLPDSYKIVVVGVTPKEKKSLPRQILGITRTNNITELAEIYTSADLYLNLTYEDTFPTTNLEALACGTPVLTYETGGCPEAVDEKSGMVVRCGDLGCVRDILLNRDFEKFLSEDCIKRSKAFDKRKRFLEYIELYRDLVKEN